MHHQLWTVVICCLYTLCNTLYVYTRVCGSKKLLQIQFSHLSTSSLDFLKTFPKAQFSSKLEFYLSGEPCHWILSSNLNIASILNFLLISATTKCEYHVWKRKRNNDEAGPQYLGFLKRPNEIWQTLPQPSVINKTSGWI